ncbi:hypothetical protein [Eubacterium sp. AF34-35BH]|uniref:hypothetical protein n=1 Tax=Eubacterium sp. AF34-35BH TaxID=2293107 RepID=UPI000E4C8DB3|nr:hypothetical protein [Eubacterium sp. AF34-35BH]RHP23606.1 hypothetical protein DWZ69_01490 [Eubacterium sp. AF34-35BH]
MGKTAQIMEWNNEYEQYSEEEIKMIKHLPMKPGEIMARYKRSAAGKEERLKLLAELNGCSENEIIMILEMEGLKLENKKVKEKVKKKRKERAMTETATQRKITEKEQKRKKEIKEKVPAIVYNTIDIEYKRVNERIEVLKKELDIAEKTLVQFADFLGTHVSE